MSIIKEEQKLNILQLIQFLWTLSVYNISSCKKKNAKMF